MTADTALSAHDLSVDRELADFALSFRFLLALTPINLESARARFERDGQPPTFEYRPLEDDPAVMSARLDDLAVDTVQDRTLRHLLLARERELRVQVEMLACRGTDDFRSLGVELYGAVSPALLAAACAILEDVTPLERSPREATVNADAIAERARHELDHYRQAHPDLEAHVEIREGTSGVMVSNGDLLISPTIQVPERRVDALLQHEIGTHLVTHVNGAAQPIRVLAAGLAGYEGTQEGLAVLAEHLVGGLSANRMRQLAARVVAVHHMLGGKDFPAVHRDLTDLGMSSGQAFTTAMRVFRSGGLAKDAVYLRGLHDLVAHLRTGGDLEVLWLGKLPLTDVPLVQELRDRGVLDPPLVRPRYIDQPSAQSRLQAIRQSDRLTQLIGG